MNVHSDPRIIPLISKVPEGREYVPRAVEGSRANEVAHIGLHPFDVQTLGLCFASRFVEEERHKVNTGDTVAAAREKFVWPSSVFS